MQTGTPPPHEASDVEAETIDPQMPICTGYLDNTLAIFQSNNHPFVLISTLALTWSGVNVMGQPEIDVLVRSSQLEAIVKDLVASGEWKLTKNRAAEGEHYDKSMVNYTPIRDIWLKSCYEDPWFTHLRLWPEGLYKLSVECRKIEVHDILNTSYVLVQEEWYPDPYQRFGPPRLSKKSKYPMPRLQFRAKFLRMGIPIFVPDIEDHLNATLDQRRAEIESGLAIGSAPQYQIRNFIRYLYLDWAPNREWILQRVHKRNQELMIFSLARYRRKLLILWDPVLKTWVFNKLPWELSIAPEHLTLTGSDNS